MSIPGGSTLARNGFRALNSVVLPAVKRGLWSPLPVGAGLVVLETVGRRSGLRREMPLASLRLGDRLLVSTIRHPSQWVENVASAGTARVWMWGTSHAATATVRRGRLQTVVLDTVPPAL